MHPHKTRTIAAAIATSHGGKLRVVVKSPDSSFNQPRPVLVFEGTYDENTSESDKKQLKADGVIVFHVPESDLTNLAKNYRFTVSLNTQVGQGGVLHSHFVQIKFTKLDDGDPGAHSDIVATFEGYGELRLGTGQGKWKVADPFLWDHPRIQVFEHATATSKDNSLQVLSGATEDSQAYPASPQVLVFDGIYDGKNIQDEIKEAKGRLIIDGPSGDLESLGKWNFSVHRMLEDSDGFTVCIKFTKIDDLGQGYPGFRDPYNYRGGSGNFKGKGDLREGTGTGEWKLRQTLDLATATSDNNRLRVIAQLPEDQKALVFDGLYDKALLEEIKEANGKLIVDVPGGDLKSLGKCKFSVSKISDEANGFIVHIKFTRTEDQGALATAADFEGKGDLGEGTGKGSWNIENPHK